MLFLSSQTSLASSGSGRKQRRSVERRSVERRKQGRSPSERKIGIVRRRSQEMARKTNNAVPQVKLDLYLNYSFGGHSEQLFINNTYSIFY